jgi:hypothetical protein
MFYASCRMENKFAAMDSVSVPHIAARLGRPFRAGVVRTALSQGVALGWNWSAPVGAEIGLSAPVGRAARCGHQRLLPPWKVEIGGRQFFPRKVTSR